MNALRPLLKIVIPTLFIAFLASFLFVYSSKAAALANVYLYMNRIQAGVTTGIVYILAINTSTTIPTGGTIQIDFPDAEDATWCRTAGTMTIAGVGTADSVVDLAGGGWDITAALPGTLVGNCAQGAVGSSDRITITGLTALTAGVTYGVRISGNVGILGTHGAAGTKEITVTASNGAVSDSMTFRIQLVTNDSVVISATVVEAPSVGCSISTNTVALGTLYPGGQFVVGSHDISTSATRGYYWAAYGTGDGSTDAGLWKSVATTHLIPSSTRGATIDLRVAGSDGFGFTVSDPGGAVVPANFSNGTLGIFGTINRTSVNARLILSHNGVQVTPENATITYGARASTSAQPGSYQEIVTFVCGGYY